MRTLVILFVSLGPALASADPKAAAPKPVPAAPAAAHKDDCAAARAEKRLCVIDMGQGDSIEGDSPTANGTVINAVAFTKHGSLIRIRRDFIAEIVKSADDL